MSLAKLPHQRTFSNVRVATSIARNDCAGLFDTPAGILDRDALAAHLGKAVIHACVDRDFTKSYRTITHADGRVETYPRYYRLDSEALAKCEYAVLTTKQYAAVMVVDVDQPGTAGGHPSNLAPAVKEKLAVLVQARMEPAWVGINPLSGKAQFIWLIDPVFSDKDGNSHQMDLLAATSRILGELLDHDPHFSHRFSRNPFYTGKSPTAYRWYCQHKRVIRLGDFIKQVREMAGLDQYEKAPQKFTSGRELINAVKTRREQAEAFKALAQDVESELGDRLDKYDQELIDGVRILWINPPSTNAHGEYVPGVAARDETAFRHALKTGHRLRQAGKRLKDAPIIDAYEHAYKVAQAHGGAGRIDEMPPMSDRLTMARRVRSYVTTSTSPVYQSHSTTDKATSSERKALATMGRRGGKKTAERLKTDPNGEYAQAQRQKLAAANKRRQAAGADTRGQILTMVSRSYNQLGKIPSWNEIAEELGVSRRTVAYHVAALKKAELFPVE